MAKTILIVDDEQDILDLLSFNLKREGYSVVTAADGDTALALARSAHPDLVILDVMLPGRDGWEVLRELRQDPATRNLTVIFLTARDTEVDEIVGLELGADDYMVKPVSMNKLLARVKLALRKIAADLPAEAPVIRSDDIVVDASRYEVRVAGQLVSFTKREFEILLYLIQRPGRVISRETLLNDLWGDSVVVIDRTIDVHIRKIREKLGDSHMHHIETIKGVGYRFISRI
ncbi:MAG TPA: response regulator transcription factor [bacterium]|nr:response regulator transcription factor [bacterium]HPR86649.1 response regulator transcription factor [bacterium]